jgi:chaperonin cofactor prefoldin
MALNAEDLAKRLAALSERFTALAATLTQTTQQLQASGTVPSETVVEEITKIRTEFVDVRHRLLEAARSLSINVPAISEVNSLSVLEPVLQTVGQALAAQEKKAALAEARTRVMSVLDRVLTITHSDGPNFAALVQCLVKAKEIRQAAQDPTAFDSENAPAFLEGIPAFGALLSIIEGRDALDDDKFAVLDEAVTQAFGRTLAVAAARGKLTVGAGPASVAERVTPSAPKAPTAPPRPAAVTAAPAPSAVLTPSPAPVAAAAPSRNIIITEPREPAPREPVQAPEPAQAREPVLSREPAQAREPSQAAEQGTQDEAAQWWVSAWARWTSWKGTLSFDDAVKEELGKYNYVLSVPIQKSTDYEEGLLAYGYSILLDHIEHRFSGFVNKALNSLKTFQPGAPGAPKSVGAHLYNVLVSEGRLQEIYPEFVKSVLLAAVPEPGVWTHARILESTTETRIFTHPSNRIGDPEHNSQRLTQERQRFADHRFPVVVAPITARFFAIAADLREPRSIDVKLVDGRSDSDHAWLLTMPPVGRADLKSEVLRLFPEGTSVPGLGRDYATLWVAVFNPDPNTEKKYELTLSLKQQSAAKQSAGAFRSARSA